MKLLELPEERTLALSDKSCKEIKIFKDPLAFNDLTTAVCLETIESENRVNIHVVNYISEWWRGCGKEELPKMTVFPCKAGKPLFGSSQWLPDWSDFQIQLERQISGPYGKLQVVLIGFCMAYFLEILFR